MQKVNRTSGDLIDDCLDGRKFQIEVWQRGHDDCAHFGGGRHRAQMAEMQWRLPGQENERPPLFEMHVGGANQKIVGKGMGNRGQRAHRTGRNDHSLCAERTGGYARANIVD